LDFLSETFFGGAYLMGMRNNTIAITAESFEKLFVHNFHNTFGLDLECRSNDHDPGAMHKYYPKSTDWRQIAWKALLNKDLGDALRQAVLSLPVKYREVLFLRDVKNLDTEEAAWIMGIAAGAVKAWLCQARNLVREALASALSSRLSSKCSNLASFYCDLRDSGSQLVTVLR